MALINIKRPHAGSWLGLPDYGITESVSSLFGGQRTAQGGSNIVSGQPRSSAQSFTPTTSQPPAPIQGPVYSGPVGQVLGARAGGGGNTAAPTPSGSLNTLDNNVQDQLKGGLGMVDEDYNSYISSLNTQEGNIRRGAESATQTLEAAYAPARTSINQQKAQAEQSYATQEQQANTQSKNAMQQARDLYRQLQQQNIAQLSGSGISSSSVAEALAENLGVETARRIAGVTGSRDEVLSNIAKERTNMNNYVSQRLSDLDSQLAAKKGEIQTSLLNQIDQLNSARNVAASDRANRRQQLILNAQNSVAELQAQAQDFAQSLQQWQAQNASRLQQTAVSFDDLSRAMKAARNFQTMGIGGQGQGGMYGDGAYYINPNAQRRPDEFDYAQYGL